MNAFQRETGRGKKNQSATERRPLHKDCRRRTGGGKDSEEGKVSVSFLSFASYFKFPPLFFFLFFFFAFLLTERGEELSAEGGTLGGVEATGAEFTRKYRRRQLISGGYSYVCASMKKSRKHVSKPRKARRFPSLGEQVGGWKTN